MLSVFYYCIKVVCCSAVLYGYYRVVLHNSRFHQWNRYYLLASVLLSFCLPLLQIVVPLPEASQNSTLILRGVSMMQLGDEYVSQLGYQQHLQPAWPMVLAMLYAISVGFLAVLFLKNISRIKRLKRLYPCEFMEGIALYNTLEPGTPFSFFNSIFWNKRVDIDSGKGRQMLRHELAHIKEHHSADKILLEIVIMIAWWNPFMYLVRKELAVIHEFIADQKASNGDDDLQYASLLLMKAMEHEPYVLTNPFFQSQLKRRFNMLTAAKNPKFSYFRRLMVLPILTLSILVFSFKYKELQDKGVLKSPTAFTVIIDAGHGGTDNGAIGVNGLREDDISLAIAKKIKSLSEGSNINVILSRSTDTLAGSLASKEASLVYRTRLGEEYKADFFISLHMNSDMAGGQRLHGMMAYVSKTNLATNAKSRLLASALINEMSGGEMPVMQEIKTSSKQGVYVLDKNSRPSVLLEVGFITNMQDASFIQQEKNQEFIARNILNAIAKHGKQIQETTTENIIENKNIIIPVAEIPAATIKIKSPVTINRAEQLYLGKPVVTVRYTADAKGYIIQTDDKKSYFLSVSEAVKARLVKETEVPLTSVANASKPYPFNNNDHRTYQASQDSFSVRLDGNTKEPLYILNGEILDKNILKTIDPSMIKSIDVLKGASAIEAYGEKGKNGVIRILTKTQVPITFAAPRINSQHTGCK